MGNGTSIPAHAELGDSHNFGRRVSISGDRVRKPRTLFWEWLVLAADSPLRLALDRMAREAPASSGLDANAFSFLPSLAFSGHESREGGEVERVDLDPLPALSDGERTRFARLVGRSIALFAWLGVSDLHWENLVLGVRRDGGVVFGPLDVEIILSDLSLPTETKLLPDADPEYAALCRHACGVRRALPWLGKPIRAGDLVAMASDYRATLALLDRQSNAVAEALAGLPGLADAPIRVCLRSTGDYVEARRAVRRSALWPPLLDAEAEQLARGDIPYFFRLYGRPGIHWFPEPELKELGTLPSKGDVPKLDRLLSVAKGLRSSSRKSLREEGLFALLGAFDHPSMGGKYEDRGLEVAFQRRSIVLTLKGGEELRAHRDLGAYVGSVYLPCTCGEVRTVFVPPVTTCEGGTAAPPPAKVKPGR
ncbi:MAG: hypothetical protein U0414_27410 [Polyangiaceae bacterium]